MPAIKFGLAVLAATLLAPFSAAIASAQGSDTIAASGGDIRITPITHASLQIEHAGKVIHVDPVSRGNYESASKADLILVTDIHGDHLDPEMISKIRKPDASIVAPAAVASQLEGAIALANGETKTVAGVSITGVPMYNLERGPEPGKLFHDKGRGNGYVIELGGKRLYLSGDTECVPEIRELKSIDIAFMTMNLPYTMPPSEAAECVKAFAPKIAYPYHHRGSNLDDFIQALGDRKDIEVRIRNWYP